MPPEMSLLDGVLERHKGLRGASVELGAGWVPDTCHAFQVFHRS